MALKYKEKGYSQDKATGSHVFAEAYESQEFKEWVNSGRFIQVIKELAGEEDFRYLTGKSESPLGDEELVLRFACFYLNGFENYYGPTGKFINDTLAKYRNISPRDEVKLRADFRHTVHIIRSLFGRSAFKRFYRGDRKNKNGRWETQQLNVSLFDILMHSFATLNLQKVLMHKDQIDEALIDLMTTDQEFIDSIELGTGSKIIVSTRFEKWSQALHKILDGATEAGNFSYSVKFDLYAANNTCRVCGSTITMFDDSTIDGMNEYWKGNQLIPANARVVHRYCKSEELRMSDQ